MSHSRNPPPSVTPGLVLLGCGCGILAAVLLTLSAFLPPEPWTASHLAVRACVALLGCLAAVTAESLFFARPWAPLASRVLVGGCFAALVAGALRDGLRGGVVLAAVLVVVGVAVVMPLLTYIAVQLSPGAWRGPRSRRFP